MSHAGSLWYAACPVQSSSDASPGAAVSDQRRAHPIVTMPDLVFDVLIEVAAFCAGAFDFGTLAHLALSCKCIYDAVKPHLDVPILVWTDKVVGEKQRLREFLSEYDLSSHPGRETFRPLTSAWSRIQ